MITIFYDLETTSLNKTGQILNYCFIAVDDSWKELKRLTGLVKISSLQLPEPGAIAATQLDVLEHQQKASDTEFVAAHKIREFLEWAKKTNSNANAILVGYNSAKFDLDYLRTTFVRNGIYPYGTYEPRDFMFLTQYLYATNVRFRNAIPKLNKNGKEKVSVALEHVATSFGLLEGKQQHESEFDVELLIKLARHFETEYNHDIREFNSYQLKELHDNRIPAVSVCEFSRAEGSPIKKSWKTFLYQEGAGAFWVDLDSFKKKRESRDDALEAVRRYKMYGDLIWVEDEEPLTQEIEQLAIEARALLGRPDSDEIFGESNCHIEEFIYRLGIDNTALLAKTIQGLPKIDPELSEDIRILAKRFWLDNAKNTQSAEYKKAFHKYCIYRYGGGLPIKNYNKDEEAPKGTFHPTLKELFADLEAQITSTAEPKIFNSLKQFYLNSEIYKAAGQELLA